MSDNLIRICPNCFKQFEVTGRTGRKIFCSEQCRNANRNRLRKKPPALSQREGIPLERDRLGISKGDIEKYRKRAKESEKNLVEVAVDARNHGESYGKYISHAQSAKEDELMRLRHLEWKRNLKKQESKRKE